MNSSTSSSEARRSTPSAAGDKKIAAGARLFLAAMAGSLVLAATAASLAPESYIHSGPEFGMAEAFEDHIAALCSAKAAPDLLIIGDSRAVAGVSVTTVRAAGVNAEKVALGGSGIFTGWAMLDRLIDCGVRPKTVVMAYGTVHMLDTGAIMERTINYNTIKGPRTGFEYGRLSAWEDREARKLAFKAVSILGAGPALVDLTLMRPALKNVLERPAHALENHRESLLGKAEFAAGNGDVYYGRADHADGLPDEKTFSGDIRQINLSATTAVADLGRKNGFNVLFYILPLSETAHGLDPSIYALAEKFRSKLPALGVTPMNDVWYLPDNAFGDPSHVNPKGRAIVTADFLARLSDAGLSAANSGTQMNNPVPIAPKKVQQSGQ